MKSLGKGIRWLMSCRQRLIRLCSRVLKPINLVFGGNSFHGFAGAKMDPILEQLLNYPY